jgi:hypothetical protein
MHSCLCVSNQPDHNGSSHCAIACILLHASPRIGKPSASHRSSLLLCCHTYSVLDPLLLLLLTEALFWPNYRLCTAQISLAFSLPTPSNLLQLLLATAVALSWVWNAPLAMHQVRGMQQLAVSVCNSCRGALELLLYITVDLAAMPGAPGAGLTAFGLPDRCETGAAYAQLLVYGSLMFAFFVPLYTSYAIELHHKLSFWRRRGVVAVADRSVLMPLPQQLLLSHVLVCCAAMMLLWVTAEQIAVYLPAAA